MFNTSLLLTPCNRQEQGFFPPITAFFCLCETCWATSFCSKFCFPFCSFLPAAALFLGRSPEANLLTAYSFWLWNTAKTQPGPCWSSQGNGSLRHSWDKENLVCLKMKKDSTGWGRTFPSFHICPGQIRWAQMCVPSLPVPSRTTLHHNALGTVWV